MRSGLKTIHFVKQVFSSTSIVPVMLHASRITSSKVGKDKICGYELLQYPTLPFVCSS